MKSLTEEVTMNAFEIYDAHINFTNNGSGANTRYYMLDKPLLDIVI
jgi:hypothetical protein